MRTDARGYVTAIANGDDQLGYLLAREPNPMISACSRICAAPCETACRRGSMDEPIAIRPLKRFVAERHGVEALHHREVPAPPGQSATAHYRSTLRRLASTPGRKRGRVAVIGSGPAGLGAAHDLAILGHQVTIFEASPVPGGMLRLGVPQYRLSHDLLDLEIQAILDLGVELRLNTAVGEQISLAEIRRTYDAVFISTGLRKGRDLRIEGADLDGVFKAVDFLLNANMGYRVNLGRRVIVVGGGNVAVDAARTALRARMDEVDLEKLTKDELRELLETARAALTEMSTSEQLDVEMIRSAFDVARTAVRLGVSEVHMVALESWEELPAAPSEIEEALEEGIQIHTRLGPHRIVGHDGKVAGLETIRVKSVFDEQGRFNPTFIPNTESIMECDTIILAIGQAADLSFLEGTQDIQVSPRGLIVADPQTMATTAPGIYAGGDVVYGPRILIEGVRDGQRAARSIEGYIQGRQVQVVRRGKMTPIPNHRMPDGYERIPRHKVPTTPLDRRIGIAEVEIGYDEVEARAAALRCFNCGINTIFDGTKCILCNGCVDVCPWSCLKIVALKDLAGDERLAKVVQATYGLPLAAFTRPDAPPAAAMLKDETICTRCGLCARRCPTGAITMAMFTFEEELVYTTDKVTR